MSDRNIGQELLNSIAAVMLEAADELEAIYRNERGDGSGGIHRALQSRFDRDMDLVHRLRSAAKESISFAGTPST